MIREVALECPERGLVLLRVRDELRLTVEAYQTLYHNSIAYGRAKSVQAESGLADLEKEQKEREARRDELVATRRELELRVAVRKRAFGILDAFYEMVLMRTYCFGAATQRMEKRAEDERYARERRHVQELAFLRQQHEELLVFHLEMSKGP